VLANVNHCSPAMKRFSCERCGARVFFENVACEACKAELGFIPGELTVGSFEQDDLESGAPLQRLASEGSRQYRRCAHSVPPVACNWMVRADDPEPLCLSCRTTEVFPSLNKPENGAHWSRIEAAKRRMTYDLLALGLPVPNKEVDPVHGVAFHFLEETDPKQKVLTGHDDGLITLNIAEADDARREKVRASMNEPYRTLLGHFRHEIGHYYWDRLIANTPWQDRYRELFGDERADYGEALKRHYESPVADWPKRFISVYASSHPWEDWAECWAHYLHLWDGLETAAAWGMRLDAAVPGAPPVRATAMEASEPAFKARVINDWLPISQFSNSMSRSLGGLDNYPFVMPDPVLDKLDFIHQVVTSAARGDFEMNIGSECEAEVHDA
jgi:hypothetical protein